MTTTVACLHYTDQLRPAGRGAFPTAPVHVGTGDTACHNRRDDTAEADLWGIQPTLGTDWLFERHPDYTS